jgi:hypothetical protein
VRLGGAAGTVRVAGQSVDDEHGVLARSIQLAPGLVAKLDLLQGAAKLGLERAYSMKMLVRAGRGSVSPGPRV